MAHPVFRRQSPITSIAFWFFVVACTTASSTTTSSSTVHGVYAWSSSSTPSMLATTRHDCNDWGKKRSDNNKRIKLSDIYKKSPYHHQNRQHRRCDRLMMLSSSSKTYPQSNQYMFELRGGEQQELNQQDQEDLEEAVDNGIPLASSVPASQSAGTTATKSSALTMLPVLSDFGSYYAACLQRAPIITKSVTAGCIFGLSDVLAQAIEKRSSNNGNEDQKKTSFNLIRALSNVAVGLFYFGPASHYWYDWAFSLLPGTSLVSTLQKAVLGQCIFGPLFTCVFFAVNLMQAGQFNLGNWRKKIVQDLPGVWRAGLGFWGLVDLVSYSSIPKDFIPLFVNLCSLIWTIYLSLIANRAST